VSNDPENVDQKKIGTTIHIGRGVFVTNAHRLQWPKPDLEEDPENSPNPANWTYNIELISGSGNLMKKLKRQHSQPLKTSISASIIGYPEDLIRDIQNDSLKTRPLANTVIIPRTCDIALLKAKKYSWLSRLRQHERRPHLLPGPAPGLKHFPILFMGLNGDKIHNRYHPTTPVEEVKATKDKCLPYYISFARGTASSHNFEEYHYEDHTVYDGNMIRHTISCLSGSSGSAIIDEDTHRMIALNVAGEVTLDNKLGRDIIEFGNQNLAVTWQSEVMRRFIRDYIIPTVNCDEKIVAEWRKLLPVN